jgi:Mn2+/Fe2+ NRAMP family transporter
MDATDIKSPPTSFFQRIKFLGPGFILSASIVGSGELIATTTLGAKAGFVTFWVIIVSCLVKVALQLEFGKNSILYGHTAMQAFNKLPGKKLGKAHWSVWTFFALLIIKISQLGGIVGGVALALHIVFPSIKVWILASIAGLFAALLVFKGIYSIIEKLSLVMILLFTILTFTSLYFLQFTDFAITAGDIQSGLLFRLPQSAVIFAIAAFGITGVGGDEIIHYTYWCSEKGYSRYTGEKSSDEEWVSRAKGWIKVMELDAIAAMIIYTLVTAAFYLLGAAVLNGQGEIPQGYAMIETLSNMYTETLGEEAKYIFLLGAVVVLFSTLFSALAAWTRQLTDIFGQVGWINYEDEKVRKKSIAMLAFVLPFLWVSLFLFIQLPMLMVIFGGAITSVILLLVIYAAIHFRFHKTPPEFKPKLRYDIALGTSILVILFIAVYGIVQLV